MAGIGAAVVGLYLHLSLALGSLGDVAAFVCIEATVLGEARGESVTGQAMVRRVILNRALSDDAHPCVVVARHRQFDGFSLRHIVHFSGQWWQQQLFVKRLGCGRATHFHATYVSPRWSRHRSMKRLCRVGGHIFYEELK